MEDSNLPLRDLESRVRPAPPVCEWCARPDSNRHAVKRQALDLLGLPKFPHERRLVGKVGVEPTGDLSVRRGLNAVAKPFAYLPIAEEEGVLFRENGGQPGSRTQPSTKLTRLQRAAGPSLRVAQEWCPRSESNAHAHEGPPVFETGGSTDSPTRTR